ncbi:alpha/beta hydrolase family protein [Streptomyces panaciradicis]|uniref:alpha/beta hydrolase family protein n=1 Tax=Streptomyces panaciradicis TaxID=1470261 RepID=UPI00201CF9D8|nr:hydrolase [Streptomyces panaciradicis]MCL6667518.1 hydrolase [Streptomyces panaciradicis]
MLTRRAALLSAVAATLLPGITARTASAAPRTAGLLKPTLPPPSGPHPVGTLSLRLVDRTRSDPWVPSRPYRELMVSVRYPARAVDGHPAAPQMLPGEAAAFDVLNSFTGVPAGVVDWSATRTHAHEGAPIDRSASPRPVICYSPGAGDPRSLGTTLCDDLASRGHVVVMLDHTYDAVAVQFPDGRVEKTVLPAEYDKASPDEGRITALLRKTLAVRVADVRFLLDALPGALPGELSGALDMDRVGMFGQSAGGFTALQAMHDDRRIAAAADLDGVLAYVQQDSTPGNLSTVAADGLDRPFLLMGMDGNDLDGVPSWDALWRHSPGWHRGLTLRGAEHATYTDAEALIPQLAHRLGLPRETVVANIGTIPPRRAIAAERACLAAFFDRWLRGRDDDGLLDGRSGRYPEMRMFPQRPA